MKTPAFDPAAVGRLAAPAQPQEQLRYARWLEIGTRAGFALLVLLFLAYAAGLTVPHVAHQRLPQVWMLPVDSFLRATDTPAGWGWLALVRSGDIANLVGVALLAGCSVPCLLALLPLYARRGDRLQGVICLAEVAVIALAASGVLTAGH